MYIKTLIHKAFNDEFRNGTFSTYINPSEQAAFDALLHSVMRRVKELKTFEYAIVLTVSGVPLVGSDDERYTQGVFLIYKFLDGEGKGMTAFDYYRNSRLDLLNKYVYTDGGRRRVGSKQDYAELLTGDTGGFDIAQNEKGTMYLKYFNMLDNLSDKALLKLEV